MSAFKDDSPAASAPQASGGTHQGADAPRSPAASEKNTSRSQQAFREALAVAKEREIGLTTVSGRAVEPVYLPAEIDEDYETRLGFPGQYPFTRGIHANLYRGRLWTMRQFAGFGAAEETNARFKYLLEKGQTGLSTAFDLPTLMGLDSDHPNSAGEVGRLGVAIDTLDDFERLFAGIDLGAVSVSMTINAPAAIVLAFYLATAERQGVAWDTLRGTLQNDILKEYHAQNEFVFPPRESVRLVIDTIEFCTRHVPQFNPVSISGYHIREAGSTAAEELAFTLADGFHYVEQTLARGLPVDHFAPRLSFFFNSHNDFLEEIAKFRAARRIWARHLRERYGAKDPRSWALRFHAQTSGVSLQAQQPEVNVVRVAYQALAAVLGGCQSLHTNSRDETLSLPTLEAVTIALRTQQVLAYETGAANSVDPLGGSYQVEAWTDALEAEAEAIFAEIERAGGMIAAIDAGYFRRRIAESAFRYQTEVDAHKKLVVGVNAFTEQEPSTIPLLEMDPEIETRQQENLARVKAARDSAAVEHALATVRRVAASQENIMPALMAAARSQATLGETVNALADSLGRYRRGA
ncbi:MAG TPA: methylmalonyl-CoA mutase family protein [Pirellulales bacterium]|nr:methylmalonyl-CoA mutase family protein [Pirellulales bacterium]